MDPARMSLEPSCGGTMEHLRKAGRRARAFVSGDYPGPPVDYLMALILVLAAMGATIFAS